MTKNKTREWPTLMTIPQAAKEVNLSKSTLRHIIMTNNVKTVKSGKTTYINMDSLSRVLNSEE